LSSVVLLPVAFFALAHVLEHPSDRCNGCCVVLALLLQVPTLHVGRRTQTASSFKPAASVAAGLLCCPLAMPTPAALRLLWMAVHAGT
jgi:hypothetical protein